MCAAECRLSIAHNSMQRLARVSNSLRGLRPVSLAAAGQDQPACLPCADAGSGAAQTGPQGASIGAHDVQSRWLLSHDWPRSDCFSRAFRSDASVRAAEGAAEDACPAHECRRGDDDSLFCGACGALLPTEEGQSYFRLLGLPEGEFRVNDSALDRQYKALQRQLHPDKFSNRPAAERELSEQASSLVNQAFSTLKSPLKRAEYILQQHGIEAGEGTTIMDEDLLMGVMEAREAVEATQSEAELRRFSTTFQTQADGCIEGLAEAFASGDLEQAQELTTLLCYIERIQTAILDKL